MGFVDGAGKEDDEMQNIFIKRVLIPLFSVWDTIRASSEY